MSKPIYLLLTFLIIVFTAFSQSSSSDDKPEKKADTVEIKAIPLTDLSDALNNAQKEIKSFQEMITKLPELQNFDSLYTAGRRKIETEKQLLTLNESQFGQREISDALKEWKNYAGRLSKWLELTGSNLSIIEENLHETDKMLKRWDLTLNQLRQDDINYSLRATTVQVVNQIKETQSQLKSQQDNILIKQDKLNSLLFEINDVIFSLQKEEKLLQTEYFTRTSAPMWEFRKSTSDTLTLNQSFNNSIKRHKKNFEFFYLAYSKRFSLHILILILLIIGFFYQNKVFILSTEENLELYTTSKEVVSRFVLSAFILTLILSVWIYPSRQNDVDDLLQFLLLLISFSYLAKGSRSKQLFLSAVVFLFFLNQVQVFLNGYVLITRPVSLIEAIFGAWILFMMIRPGSEIRQELENRNWKFILLTVPALVIFAAISFFANILGYTNLAVLLSNTTSNSIFNAIDIVLATLIIRSVVIALLHSSLSKFSNLIKNKGLHIEKKVLNIIQFLAILIWIKNILINLTIYSPIYDWFAGLFSLSFKIGDTNIVLGKFFSFLIIIIITVYLTRMVKLVLEEEVFPRISLPRGVPGATSMIVGYVLAALGGYLAISAAGVDLGTFGLIVGALSVGIGFGLQGIVVNFIAGLILAFERPLQVGDTIEMGTLTGEVKSIGVRSSKIRTYDGMEVIIPNGNLISNNLINWTLSDRKRRYDINVGVAYGADPKQVLEILRKVADENPDVLKYPAPWALFDGFGDSSLNFRIRIWTSIDTGLQTKSDIAVAINDALNKEGIEIPFPQRDLHIRSVDPGVHAGFYEEKKKPSRGAKTGKDANHENNTKK